MSANDKQVGGSHYASGYQHWDLVIDLELPYLEAQVVKYTERHAKKNGRQDLEKSIHFTEKLIEVARQRRVAPRRALTLAESRALDEYIGAKGPEFGADERGIIIAVVDWSSVSMLSSIRDALVRLVDRTYPREGE